MHGLFTYSVLGGKELHFVSSLKLKNYSQPLIPDIPLLAVLLNKMITHDLGSRFSSLEALQFCKFIQSTLSEEQFLLSPPLNNENLQEFTQEISWDRIDPDSIGSWSTYCTRPVHFTTRVLRWITSYRIGKTLVQSIRRWLLHSPPKGRNLASNTLQ